MDTCHKRGLAALQNWTRLPTPVFYSRNGCPVDAGPIVQERESTASRTADCSAGSQCGPDCRKQICLAKWLEQDAHSSLFERSRPDGVIGLGCDEDGRNFWPRSRSFCAIRVRS